MNKPTKFTASDIDDIIAVLRLKPINVEQLVNDHKTIKFHKITSRRHIEKMKKGELYTKNEFDERPSFKRKIESMTKTLSLEIERSLVRKKSFVKLEEVPMQEEEQEEIFHKIPTRYSMGNINGTFHLCILIYRDVFFGLKKFSKLYFLIFLPFFLSTRIKN